MEYDSSQPQRLGPVASGWRGGVTACSVLALAVVLAPGGADAAVQLPEDKTVTERPRPDYDPVGAHAGAFTIVPRIEIGEEYDTNIFATESNAVDDLITVIRPSLTVKSDTSSHLLRFTADAGIGRHADRGNEDYEDFSVSADGRLDIERQTQLFGGLRYRALHADRSSPDDTGTSEPVTLDIATARLGARHEFNRLSVRLDGELDRYDFDDATTASGTPVNEDDRDRDVYTVSLRAGYELAPEYEGFVRASFNARNYDQAVDDTGVDRDSTGYEIVAGATADFTGVTFGEVFVGYLAQDYDDALLSTVEGFSFGATVTWNPTPLTTVKANAARLVRETTLLGTSGVLRSAFGVSVDHELLRQLLLHAELRFAADEYKGTSRDDTLFDAVLAARYMLNRNAFFGAEVRHSRRASDVAGSDFERNVFMLRLGLQY